MKQEEIDQAWIVAYGLAFAVTAMGSELRGMRNSPADIDQRARALADQATATIQERADQAARRKK